MIRKLSILPTNDNMAQAQTLCRIAEILTHAKSGQLTKSEQAEAAIYADLLLFEARVIAGENAAIESFECGTDEHAEVNNAATL